MRQAIAWSHDLLSDAERTLFRRLAVFAGGFSFESAEAMGVVSPVTDDTTVGRAAFGQSPGADPDVAALIASLVDKSLVHPLPIDARIESVPPRFNMLETIREFGLDQLEELGDGETARAAHASWCLDLAERAHPSWTGPDEGVWMDRLDAEIDNIRAALAWSVKRGDAEFGLRLAVALSRFWGVRGHLRDARSWLERLLALPGSAQVPPALRAAALNGLCNLALDLSDYETARICGEESLEIRRRLGDRAGIAYSLENLAALALGQGNAAWERALLEECLAIRRELGTPQPVAVALARLGGAVNRTGITPGRGHCWTRRWPGLRHGEIRAAPPTHGSTSATSRTTRETPPRLGA